MWRRPNQNTPDSGRLVYNASICDSGDKAKYDGTWATMRRKIGGHNRND